MSILNQLFEFFTGNYIQDSHFELNKFTYDLTREYAERHNMTIDQVLSIQHKETK